MTEEKKQKIIELRKNGIGYKRIGRTLSISFRQVSDVLISAGMYSHVTMPDEHVVSKIISMYQEEHLGSKKIAKAFKMSPNRVIDILKINGIEITPSGYHVGYLEKVDQLYFKNIDSEHKAYWLGFLYADGYNNEKDYQIELGLKLEDRYLLECFQKDTKSQYSIRDRVVELNGKSFRQSRFAIYSKQMSKDLSLLGCVQRKSLILEFPTENQVPPELVSHFMRGYFDGDGCISGSKFMINGTEDFLLKYISILRESTKISPAGSWSMDGKAYRWQHASKRDLKKIYSFLYADATVYMKRKQRRFLDIV